MFFEDFEGYKKIKNNTKLTIGQIYNLLVKYENVLGSVSVNENLANSIIIDISNKYLIDLRIEDENIIIERRLEDGKLKDYETHLEQGKDLAVAQADRMIEQIYDLLNDYIENNGIVSEHVTSVKKVLYMEEKKSLLLGGALSLGNFFIIKDETGNEIYKAKKNHINKIYEIRNLEAGKEIFSLKYDEAKNNKFTILKHPFDRMVIAQENTSVKTLLKGYSLKNELKISADYTDNHYLIEYNEIVIGAIDCLDPLLKNKYKLEINDLEKEALIVTIGIMMDIYNLKNNNDLGIQ